MCGFGLVYEYRIQNLLSVDTESNIGCKPGPRSEISIYVLGSLPVQLILINAFRSQARLKLHGTLLILSICLVATLAGASGQSSWEQKPLATAVNYSLRLAPGPLARALVSLITPKLPKEYILHVQ
jgi:hypothetical protein